jgi:mono/diheme cytochrome c family protein
MMRRCGCGFVVVAALVAGSGVYGNQVRERDPDWVAPHESSTKINPLANRPDAAAGGAKLFLQRCSTCHGPQGRGTDRAPDVTAADIQTQTDGALFWKISGGNTRGGMPAFSFLPEAQRWQVVLHLRMLARDR